MVLLENAVIQTHFNERILCGIHEIVEVLVIIWLLLIILFLTLFYVIFFQLPWRLFRLYKYSHNNVVSQLFRLFIWYSSYPWSWALTSQDMYFWSYDYNMLVRECSLFKCTDTSCTCTDTSLFDFHDLS